MPGVNSADSSSAGGQAGSNSTLFLKMRRSFIENEWANLHHADDGAALSLLPVLLLRCWGYRDRGGYAHVDQIRQLSGLHFWSMLSIARRVLDDGGIVIKLPSRRHDVWHFRDGGKALAEDGERGRFLFPMRFLLSGEWARFTVAERAILVALASTAGPIWKVYDDWTVSVDPTVVGWLEEEELIVGDGVQQPCVRNFGELDYEWLEGITGFNKSACKGAVETLTLRSIVAVEPSTRSFFCLPDSRWYLNYSRGRNRRGRRRCRLPDVFSNNPRAERF